MSEELRPSRGGQDDPAAVPPPAAYCPPPPPPPAPSRGRPFGVHRLRTLAVLIGLVAGSAVGGFLITRAATATTTPTASSVNGAGAATPTPSPSPGPRFHGGFRGLPGLAGVNLLQDAASAIGISEQTLQADLQNGQSIAQVATSNGKTAQDVISALVGDETTAINKLVSSGKITSSQASQLEANLTSMITAFVNQAGGFRGPTAGLPLDGEQAAVQAAAKAIGITPSELLSDLAGGQSVASVAQSKGVQASTVISAVTTAVDSQISSLEQSGKISSSQASQLTSEVPQRVSQWVNDDFPGWPFGPFAGPGGSFPGGPWGRHPAASPSASPTPSGT
ncbi:MAG TPA: hypothetical protein VEK76_04865 [Candidatus Binatia bacterium]|nr:hypothetical protein [Candidatus Binatia bacterium]